MKKKLFGTDGIRGEANRYPITADVALQVGQAVARVLGTARSKRGRARTWQRYPDFGLYA